ncbi:sulfate adenylyltransferase subunit 1 [Aequorivita sublithincola DSM 14238]|uniref:sulfate adenylyltransferase n=1 Tax=Aequorivita sublithincola (strain DSM 14238 / LMG 21431 / ACAM 643 / 9-3) TaxID=746697 RepID=I3YZF7_AEQSU|nr:GTP-binding protein [Aequorivita sublithincola]AFL82375.1 sulfate adenylyltransferase subunit 1 [Aequorivita sublithincola DSM 14238]
MAIDNNQLLRFTTAGSVDDGKSTLIGRLLYDSKSIFEDQLAAVENTSKKKGHDNIDLAMFTDGLKEEREQGITIDVAYRYFTTPKRKFIIADTPGHIQYTRNMITGASTANAAIILVDARHGVIEQTKRHSFIASLLQIPHLIVCINKMDLVNYDEAVYDDIVSQYEKLSSKLVIQDITYIPISALHGDNVVNRSDNMNWYKGAALLYTLETLHISNDLNKIDARFPVQTVLRPQREGFIDYRGYAGRIASGVFRKGDIVVALPSGFTSKIKSIDGFEEEFEEAFVPMSVSITLEDDIDVSRGDMIVRTNNRPETSQEFDVMLCWMSSKPSQPRTKYTVYHTENSQKAMIKNVLYKVDINTYDRIKDQETFEMNDIGRVTIRTTKPLMIDSYGTNRTTGSIILIDDNTNETVAAGMIV